MPLNERNRPLNKEILTAYSWKTLNFISAKRTVWTCIWMKLWSFYYLSFDYLNFAYSNCFSLGNVTLVILSAHKLKTSSADADMGAGREPTWQPV